MNKIVLKVAKSLLVSMAGVAIVFLPNTSKGQGWDMSGFLENVTHNRSGYGNSKIRNTLQVELNNNFGYVAGMSNFSVNAILRGSYDAVYDENEEEFGDKAGGSVFLRGRGAMAGALDPGDPTLIDDPSSTDPTHMIPTRFPSPAFPEHSTPYGQSLITRGFTSGPSMIPSPNGSGLIPNAGHLANAQFGFDTDANPNEGLEILGHAIHGQGNGVVLAYPARPCDVDSRGCIDDYLDYSESELKSPEFNDHFDFLREFYIDGTFHLSRRIDLGVRLGKQQVVWGRTDLFRVLDVLNPVDYSRHNIYDELEDIRIPQWMLNLESRFGAVGPFADLNFAFVWNFDEFRPNNLGQGGTPYSILDAGSFFRAMNVCWELGCSVGNFAGGGVTTDFGPGQIGIRQANLPDGHDQWGLKLEGVINEIGFSLNYIDYISQLPSLRANQFPATNSFTDQTQYWPYLIAFDIDFPRIQLYGGSLDLYVDNIKSAIRIEAAYTEGEEFANTNNPNLYSESDVVRYVVGLDTNATLPFVQSNSLALISAQIFGQHILDHESVETAGHAAGIPGFTKAGIPDWRRNWTATLLVRQPFQNGLVNAQIIMAHDWKAEASVAAPSVEFLLSDSWRLVVGGNIKFGAEAQKFDDCRTCNPWGPFTHVHMLHTNPLAAGSVGLSGFEPLGRFRQGPIGTAKAEDEFHLTMRYRF